MTVCLYNKITSYLIRLGIFCICVSSVIVPCSGKVYAEENLADPESGYQKTRKKWVVVPVAAYSSETGVILGTSTFYFPPGSDDDTRSSSLDIILFGTTKGQYFITLIPDLYLERGNYRFRPKLFGSYWKSSYYGIGNDLPDDPEDYDSTNIGLNISFDRFYPSGITVGPVLNFRWNDIDPLKGGKMENDAPLGIGQGFYSGAGFAVGFDSRDNTNAPHRGNLARYEYIHYLSELGSDLDFNVNHIELRHFFPTSERTTLAIASDIRISRGDIPYRLLSKPDGINILRGIKSRRFIDRDLFALMSEFRFPIKNKFSGTVFAEAAQVARNISHMKLDDFNTSIGAGLRYSLNPEQRLNFRVDIAWVDNQTGFVATVREAF